jgi:hypothetical protein
MSMMNSMLGFSYQENSMPKKRITVTIDQDIAEYLYEVPNTSAVVSDAVRDYRARQLEKELEEAYRDDAAENADLATEWEPADAKVDE